MNDDVRAIGEVTDIHGAPLTVGVYRGHVNLGGRMLGQEQVEQLAQLLVRATWEAAQFEHVPARNTKQPEGTTPG